jgi:hypothetical protein
MSAAQRTFPRIRFGFNIRPALRLCEVERILCDENILSPVPSRATLIKWIEEGQLLQGKQMQSGHWIVYQDSLINFVRNLQSEIAA